MSRVGKINPGQVSDETAPVNKEVGAKTDCETTSSLQVDRALLFAALPAAEAPETAQTAQTDNSPATETAGLHARSPQLVHLQDWRRMLFSDESPFKL